MSVIPPLPPTLTSWNSPEMRAYLEAMRLAVSSGTDSWGEVTADTGSISPSGVASQIALVGGVGLQTDAASGTITFDVDYATDTVPGIAAFDNAYFTVSANTVSLDVTAIDHDQLTNYVSLEHIDWTSTTANLNTTGTAAAASFTATGNIVVGGTVDGRDVASDGSKLDGIESSATADQTTEEIQDAAWSVLTGTQTGITVTYQDGTNDVDFVVDDLTVAGDSGSTAMSLGDTLSVVGGTDITTSMSGDTLTITSSASGLTTEEVQDIVGAMVTGNTETDITVTYQDADGTLDFEVTGGSGGAPDDAQYLTLATDATLTDERVLTAGDGIDFTDAGAGSTLTISAEAASTTNAGIIEIAVQSEMETATSTTLAVCPGNMHYHPASIKVWCRFDSAGTVNTSYNVASVTDVGVGSWRVNFTNALSAADNPSTSDALAASGTRRFTVSQAWSTSSQAVYCYNDAGTQSDATRLHLMVVGDI